MASELQHNWNGSMLGDDEPSKSFGKQSPLSVTSELRATKLREWYRLGQAYFRGFFDPANHAENLNDALQLLSKNSDAERDGFLMGWQSDVYAFEHGLQYSVEGTDHIAQEEKNYGYSNQDEGRDVLAESGIV